MTSPRNEICIEELKLSKGGGQSGPRKKLVDQNRSRALEKGRRPDPFGRTLREYERCSTGLSGGRGLSETLQEAASEGK